MPGSQENCIERLESCIGEIAEFMLVNKLKLNGDKTEFLLVGNRQQLDKLDLPLSINVCGDNIESVDTVRNLGFWFDSVMNANTHVNKTCRNCFLMLNNIRSIRYKIDQQTAKTLVQCLVISKLDYCNALLLGTSKLNIRKMQLIMNMGCRIIFDIRKFDHISAKLKELH